MIPKSGNWFSDKIMRKDDASMAEEIADSPADVEVSPPELLARGYRIYERYHVKLKQAGGAPVEQQRDVIRGGKVVAVLPIDVERNEIVLIRQFRLPAHLANGRGDLVESVAGRVEHGEQPADTARRECMEEIGTAPVRLVELFTYLDSPGITDEEVTVFLAVVDASRVPARTSFDGEQIVTLRVSIDGALAALAEGTMRNGLLVTALQWLALNRERLASLLSAQSTR
jgi:ADP-ribose pyrophosphatase